MLKAEHEHILSHHSWEYRPEHWAHKPNWVLHGGDAVPFDMKVNEVNEWITNKMLGPHLSRIREFMKAHPEVRVVGSHMSLDFYDKI